ncbi:MAG: DsbA family protein [Chitinispirillales bacterium]|jgi:protein-disulfide isomerase|nr:DsbA family protein [Chitinispirillales bacterium]
MKRNYFSALIPSIPALVLPALILTIHTLSVPADAALKNRYLDSLQRDYYVEACKSKLPAAAKNPGCPVGERLNSFVEWMDSISGAPHDSVYGNALKSHYETLAGKTKYAADIKGWPLIGDASAPLTVVMYFSGTCPLCKRNFAELYREVNAGSLKGKVKIVAKPFGITGVNKALVAAHDMGRFADIMLALAHVEGRVDEETVYNIAETMYFVRDKFKSVAESPSVAERVKAAHSEGNKNGVELVPTYFIGGRRYESVNNMWWIINTMEYMVRETKGK